MLSVLPLSSPAPLHVLVSQDGVNSHVQITFFFCCLTSRSTVLLLKLSSVAGEGISWVRLAQVSEPRAPHFDHPSVHAYKEMLQSLLAVISCYFLFICVSVEHIKISQ